MNKLCFKIYFITVIKPVFKWEKARERTAPWHSLSSRHWLFASASTMNLKGDGLDAEGLSNGLLGSVISPHVTFLGGLG